MGYFSVTNIILLFLSIIIYIIYNLYSIIDPNHTITSVNSDKCRKYKGIIGAEDVIKFGKFLVAPSDDRLKLWEDPNFTTLQVPNGGLYLINPETEQIRKLELKGFPYAAGVVFHPHGMYFTNGFLYVINHAYSRGGERVEVFTLDRQEDLEDLTKFETLGIRYKYSIKFDDMHMGRLNDLIVTKSAEGKDEIYITQYLPFADSVSGRAKGSLSKIPSFGVIGLKLKWSYVFYCKGTKSGLASCKQITSPKVSALMNNGITINPKTGLVYISRTFDRSVGVFKIDDNDRSVLHHVKEIPINYLSDNVEFDEVSNSILIGSLGNMLDHVKYIENTLKGGLDKEFKCWYGSERINLENDAVEVVVMTDNGLCGIASMAQVGNKVFMGSWAEDGILVCDI